MDISIVIERGADKGIILRKRIQISVFSNV